MTAQEAFDKIQALRELSRTTHVQTNRSERTILQSLSDADLAEVSLMLKLAGSPPMTVLGGAR